MAEFVTQLENQLMVTVGGNINGWALSLEDRDFWHDKIRDSLIEVQKHVCERCRNIKFEKMLDGKGLAPKHEHLGERRRVEDNSKSEYDSNCGLCTIISTGRNEFALLVPHSSDPLHSPESRTTLAIFEFSVWRTYVCDLYSQGALPSPDLGWPGDTKMIDFDGFRGQLLHCNENHAECQKTPHIHVKGLHVIDCQTRQIIPAPTHCDYVALSYVWGTSQKASPPRDGFLPCLLDATIEDALLVTQWLGFKYIWIDRYCIGQEKDTESKNYQIQNMHLVYQNAQLTIIAAAGDDVTFGLPGVSGKPRIARENAILGPCLLSSIRSTSNNLLRASKWMTRAWTFQEAVFSRRRLIFTQEQLFLQCRRTQFAEGIRNNPIDLHAKDDESLLQKWKPSISFGTDDGIQGLVRAVELYSQRDLTYEYDALRGFQGILSAYESQEIYHNWGIPPLNLHLDVPNGNDGSSRRDRMDGFVFGLCWRPQNLCKRRLGFPTWSWAGWNGGIRYDWFDERQNLMKSTDVDVSVELEDGEQLSWIEFEQLSYKKQLPTALSPFIWITAWCIPLTLHKTRHEKYCSVKVTTVSGDTRKWGAAIIEAQGSEDNSIYAELKKGLHTGILLAPREVAGRGHYYPYILIVEHKKEWAEKIGFFVLNGSSVGIGSDGNSLDPAVVEIIPWIKKTIRLG